MSSESPSHKRECDFFSSNNKKMPESWKPKSQLKRKREDGSEKGDAVNKSRRNKREIL